MITAWTRFRILHIRELIAHPGRTLMAMVVMGVSAGLLVAMLGISGSVTGSVDRLARGLGGNAALEITGITGTGFDEAVLARVAPVPGVDAAVPMVRTRIGTERGPMLLVGADASVTALESDLAEPLRGLATELLSGVVVGAATGYQVGDEVRVDGRAARVTGVLAEDVSDRLNGGHLVVAILDRAQQLAGQTDQLNSIQIVAEPGADVERLRADLVTAVGGQAVVADPGLRTAQAGGAIALVRYSTLMAAAAALVVSAFLIYNAMSMAVAQRRPMLSTLRVLGGRKRPMVRDLLLEAALLATYGAVGGAVVGVFAGQLSLAALPAAIVDSVEARTEYVVPWTAIPIAIVACVAAGVCAAAVAARQVYRVEPIEALAPVGVGRADAVSPVLRWGAVLVAVVTAVAAVAVAWIDFGRYSLAAITLAFGAALAACFAATGPIVACCAAVARRFGAPGALAAVTLERAPRRVWATTMTVMIGVAATVALGSASANMIDSATETFDDLARIDAFVTPSGMRGFPTGPALPGDLGARIEAVPGVDSVGPGQMAYATLGRDRVVLQGFQPGTPNDVLHALEPGVAERMIAGEGVVLSRDVAASLDAGSGARLVLPTPTGPRDVEVLQVVPYFSALGGIVVMDLDVMRQWYRSDGATVLNVFFEPDADAAAVLERVRAVVPPQYAVESGAQALDAIAASVGQGAAMSNAILWIVVLVAAVALLNTLMLSVLERRRELGVLRAMGAGRRFVLRSVLAEAAGIGVAGAGLGLAVGALTQYIATSAMSHAVTVDVRYEPSPLLVVYAVAALALALIGAVPPALRAVRLPIVAAIAVD
ncbi:ABC transporter permease [Nocardia puris]|uniref:Putative ABC transport system permease protein n=1 Tax=Nocardia puris TaxID=208602 RepID=A0A366DE62_9NOCA|nr:ABC transporter permease [Nocardia puris]MBF6211187.1 ABC transporter permease [Nocardia puris]MBF6364906.1 ABC transporter permease [Nocardia puris]MBF6458692.1 ABC transporter permease [Nocardia puris]RBO87809.1 putative ABC transport system permease protein [Nocardia puris]